MSMAVSAAGHNETFSRVIYDFSFASFNECFCTFPVADIYILSVLHRKCLDNLAAFGSENLAVNNEIGGRSVSLLS